MREEFFVDNDACRPDYIHCEIRFLQHDKRWNWLFLAWQSVEVFSESSPRHGELSRRFPAGGLFMTPRAYFMFRLPRYLRTVPSLIRIAAMTRGVSRLSPRRRTC